jgi:hypothetical protein
VSVSAQSAISHRSLAFAQRLARLHAEGAMNSRVMITRKGIWDTAGYEYDPDTPTTIYDDPDSPGAGAIAGITEAQGPMEMQVGDEPSYYSSVTVYIPQTAPVNPIINDLVYVIDCPDTELEHRVFRVMDVPAGGRLSASIALSCQGVAPSREILEP